MQVCKVGKKNIDGFNIFFYTDKVLEMYHLYADDCQLYISIKPNDRMQPLADCIGDLKGWLVDIFLLLNDIKTEAIILSVKAASF